MSRSLHRQSVYLQQNASYLPVLEKIHEPKYFLLLLLLHRMNVRHYVDEIQIYKDMKIEFNEVILIQGVS